MNIVEGWFTNAHTAVRWVGLDDAPGHMIQLATPGNEVSSAKNVGNEYVHCARAHVFDPNGGKFKVW